MSDNEGTAAQGPREDEQRLEGEIQKEINKLKYFLEETDDLIQIKDYTEMEIVTKRADKIVIGFELFPVNLGVHTMKEEVR